MLFMLRSPIIGLLMLSALCGRAQQMVVLPDSMYFRMASEEQGMKAMRFDMAAYADTLRAYRDALDAASTGIDASSPAGEARRSRLGLLRRDLQDLDEERALLRKRAKRPTGGYRERATQCGLLLARVRQLRTRMAVEGVRPFR